MGLLDRLFGSGSPQQKYARFASLARELGSAKKASEMLVAGNRLAKFVRAPENLPVLIAALQDPDPAVRYQAARSVTDSRDPGGLAALAQARQDPEERVRKLAAAAAERLQSRGG